MCGFMEMVAILDISKNTYKRYENGTAAVPKWIAEKVQEMYDTFVQFEPELPHIIDSRIARDFPHGIISEVRE